MRTLGKMPIAALLVATGCCTVAFAQQTPVAPDAEFRAAMAWAFPLNPPPDPHASQRDMHKPLHVPGSTRTYALADYDDMFGAPDWFPQDHPPMPRIVAHGSGGTWACAYCHLPNGQGRPENAPLACRPRTSSSRCAPSAVARAPPDGPKRQSSCLPRHATSPMPI